MFYIVETREQLDKVISYGGNQEVFIDVIPVDDRIHPAINRPSLIYFRPLDAKRGFILCIDHLETFSLDYREVMALLIAKIPLIYTIDKKRLLHYGFPERGLNGLKMAYKLNPNYPVFPDSSNFDTQAHKFYYTRLRNRLDVNRFIPVSKHYEKYENLFEKLIIESNTTSDYQFYNDIVDPAFYHIEANWIKIDSGRFDESHPGFHRQYSINGDLIYSEYDLYNLTARPSCSYNGLNFMGLKKDDSRNIFVPFNDIFVEFDYMSYQVKLLANLLDYHFEEDNIHEHLMPLYGETDYDTAKRLTFRYLYGRDPNPPDIDFFKQVYELRDYLWESYQKDGYILSPVRGRKITGITEITQVLPYLMQCIETETNAKIIHTVNEYLSTHKTKLVLYSYDAFLFDVALDEAPEVVITIGLMLMEADCAFSIKYGESYGELTQSDIYI